MSYDHNVEMADVSSKDLVLDDASGLNKNLVRDIYRVHKVFMFGTFQFKGYEPKEFANDIKDKIKNQSVSDFVANDLSINRLSLYPTWLIRDDLFQVFAVQFAVSHLVNSLEPKQIGNGLYIHCVVIPESVVSLYDPHSEWKFSIPNVNFEAKALCEPLEKDTVNVAEIVKSLRDGFNSLLNANPTKVIILVDRTENIQNFLAFVDGKLNLPKLVGEVIDVLKTAKPKLHQFKNEIIDFFAQNPNIDAERLTKMNAKELPSLLSNHCGAGKGSIKILQKKLLEKIKADNLKKMSLEDLILYIQSLRKHHVVEMQYEIEVNKGGDGKAIKTYFHYGYNQCIRFWPEQLVWFIPRLFLRENRNDYDYLKRIYHSDYKHGFCVHLDDEEFARFYKMLTGWNHVSVNYRRIPLGTKQQRDRKLTKINFRDFVEIDLPPNASSKTFFRFVDENGYDTDAISVDVNDAGAMPTALIESNIAIALVETQNGGAIYNKLFNYWASGDGKCHVEQCQLFHDLIANLQRFEAANFEIGAGNVLDFEHSRIIRQMDHLITVHQLFSDQNNKAVRSIVSNQIECSLGKKCGAFQTHISRRKDEDVDNKEDVKIRDLCTDTKYSLCGAHCYLLHPANILYRKEQSKATPFSTEVIEEKSTEEQKQGDSAPLGLDWGVHVLQWLPFETPPCFATFLEEMSGNPKLSVKRSEIQYVRTQCEALVGEPGYEEFELDEMSSLKLYSDQSHDQAELREAFWNRTPLEIKQNFYNWAITLYKTFLFHAAPLPKATGSNTPVPLYHGLNRMFAVETATTRFQGPFSTTTSNEIVERFSGERSGLEFTLESSYSNPLRVVTGINMIGISSFDEKEILLYAQSTPISKTKAYENADQKLVDHLMSSVQKRKTLITNKKAFYKRVGFSFKKKWLPMLVNHPLLFIESGYENRIIARRLLEELQIDIGYIGKIPLSVIQSDTVKASEFERIINGTKNASDVLIPNQKTGNVELVLNMGFLSIPRGVLIRNNGGCGPRSIDISLGVSDIDDEFVLFAKLEEIERGTQHSEGSFCRYFRKICFSEEVVFQKRYKFIKLAMKGWYDRFINIDSLSLIGINFVYIKSEWERIETLLNSVKWKEDALINRQWFSSEIQKCFTKGGDLKDLIPLISQHPALMETTTNMKRTVLQCLVEDFGFNELSALFWKEHIVLEPSTITISKQLRDRLNSSQRGNEQIPFWVIIALPFCAFSVEVNGADLRNNVTFKTLSDFVIPIACPSMTGPVSITLKVKPKDGYSNCFTLKEMINRYIMQQNGPLKIDRILKAPKCLDLRCSSDIRITENAGIIVSDKGQSHISEMSIFAMPSTTTASTFDVEPNDYREIIALSSCAGFVNDGVIKSTETTTIFINVDSVFMNHGQIECHSDGRLIIGCRGFVNDGIMTPDPFILIEGTEGDSDVIFLHLRKIASFGENFIFDGSNISLRGLTSDVIKSDISKFAFAVSVDNIDSGKIYKFTENDNFEIPIISPVLKPNGHSVTLRVYLKPCDASFDCNWMPCKTMKWTKPFTRFNLKDDVLIDSNDAVGSETAQQFGRSNRGHSISIGTEGLFSNRGIFRFVDGNGGDIIVFAVKGVYNEGIIGNGILDQDHSGGNIILVTDGGFVNNGVIECRSSGFIIVECSEFVNEGLIATRPNVVIGEMETAGCIIRNMSTINNEESIKLTVRKHRGHWNHHHPQNLLKEGSGDYYYSDSKYGPPNEDWIVFEHDEESRFIPTTVIIRNDKYSAGIKRIAIYGGNNIDDLQEWIEIDDIKRNAERQIFPIGSRQREIAYIEQFKYFKLRILENYGYHSNEFDEFAILGMIL